MKSSTQLLTLSLLSSFGLVACGGDPPAASDVRSRISNDLGHVLHETAAAAEANSDSISSTAAFTMIERVLDSSGTTALPRLATRLSGLVGSTRNKLGAHKRGAALAAPIDSEPDATDALIQELNEKLFTDANDLGDGIFQVPASLVCTTETFNDDGTTTESIDPECAQQLALADLRIRATTDGDELQLAFQVDANHDEPVVVTLTHDSLASTLDLDEAGQALTALAPLFGEDIPNTSLAGRVTSRVEVLGAAHAKFAVTIDRALAIKFADAGIDLDGPQAFRFTSAKADVAAVELDGAQHTGSAALALGASTAHVSDDQLIDLDLPGITAFATFAAGQPLHVTHIGLGERTTTISVDGARAIAIDLNPADGRALDATVTSDPATGLATLSVTPKLDLRLAVDHAALGDEAPIYDVTQVLLDGSLRGGDASDLIEVVTGTFAITTNPASFGFSATAGQCVSSQEVTDPTTGAFYDQWTAGSCN